MRTPLQIGCAPTERLRAVVAIGNRVQLPDDQLDELCRRWRIEELSVFGSVLREDFGADSDIDLLVDFQPDARHTIFDVLRLEEEFTALVGRKVDLIEKRAIARSDNSFRRRAILGAAQVIYHAR